MALNVAGRTALMLAAAVALAGLARAQDGDAPTMRLYVGTYTAPGKSEGIYRLDLNPATGALSGPRLAAKSESPSFLAFSPSGRALYAANEVGKFAGQAGGGISAFAVEAGTGALTALNAANTRGGGTCHVSVSPDGTTVYAANYGGGSVAAFALADDGRIAAEAPAGFVQHSGHSVNPRRQEGPHAHGAHPSPDGSVVAVPDLGVDQIFLYTKSADGTGPLAPASPAAVSVAPGSGPRHLAWSQDGSRAYVIQEMANTISVFDTTARPEWKSLQSVPTLPEGYTGESTTAEVVLHPNGKFLYGSNRGHDSLAIYGVEPTSGMLTPLGHQPTGGKGPRHFAIDPTGRWLVVANQGSDSLTVFAIDPKTGALTTAGEPVTVHAPVCVVFGH
jgi:6-phosphogluconolactonase